MRADGFDPRVLKFCAYTGLAFVFMWPFAAIVLAQGQYIWPPSAADSAEQVVEDYLRNLTGIRIATVVFTFASIFYATWSMAIVQMVRRREGQWPILHSIMTIAVACEVVVIMFVGIFFGCAAWRPGEVDPAVTQALNDLGWLGVLFTGAPFALFQWALAAATFLESESAVYPRWSAYFNLLASIFSCEACLVLFFKTGPMSQNGAFVFYAPMVIFFAWITTFTILTVKAIEAEDQRGLEFDDLDMERTAVRTD